MNNTRTTQIVKCVDIVKVSNKTLEFKFNKEININTEYISISFTSTAPSVVTNRFLYTTSANYLDDVKRNIEIQVLNRYCLLRSCTIAVLIMPDKIDIEQLWYDFGNLENPSLEEIDFYIKILNEL